MFQLAYPLGSFHYAVIRRHWQYWPTSPLASAIGAILSLRQLELRDPNRQHTTRMCLPLWSNTTRLEALNLILQALVLSLANSPFRCEQEGYIRTICTANGTEEVDLLAE